MKKKKRLRASARSRKRRKPASDAGTNDKEWTAEPCPNTILSRKGTIISYLALLERLFRTKQTKKEPACSVAEQAGVPIDRIVGLSIDRKGLFNLLTLRRIGLVSSEDEDLAVA